MNNNMIRTNALVEAMKDVLLSVWRISGVQTRTRDLHPRIIKKSVKIAWFNRKKKIQNPFMSSLSQFLLFYWVLTKIVKKSQMCS